MYSPNATDNTDVLQIRLPPELTDGRSNPTALGTAKCTEPSATNNYDYTVLISNYSVVCVIK